jgi:DNA-directed RNA polymerase subunit RPC12/RpoP
MPLRTRIECPACHHDLLVKRGGKCPNCGARISEHVARVRARERRIEQVVAIIGSLLVLALFLATTGIGLGLLEGVMVYAAVGAVMFYLARKTFS